MADNLRGLGRQVGPLLMIDGVPENTGVALSRWNLRYWIELARNVRGWMSHGDLMRSRTLHSLLWSISNNATAIGKGAIGLKRGQKLGGGYAIEGIMDVSRYQPVHKSFVNRLFQALFDYRPKSYSGGVVVYEATVKILIAPAANRANMAKIRSSNGNCRDRWNPHQHDARALRRPAGQGYTTAHQRILRRQSPELSDHWRPPQTPADGEGREQRFRG